jgi:hypothetical protein
VSGNPSLRAGIEVKAGEQEQARGKDEQSPPAERDDSPHGQNSHLSFMRPYL